MSYHRSLPTDELCRPCAREHSNQQLSANSQIRQPSTQHVDQCKQQLPARSCNVQPTARLNPSTDTLPSQPSAPEVSHQTSPVKHSPHEMPSLINIPKVDTNITDRQHNIFEGIWPHVSSLVVDKFPQFAELYSQVKSYNLPNFLGARRTVPSELNLPAWESLLHTYHDNEICFFLRFGWPVGYHLSKSPTPIDRNHPSADQHERHLLHFVL